MTIPNLLHKTPVTIELIDYSRSINLENLREPLGGAARLGPFVIPGQVFDQDTINNAASAGLELTVEGYVAFRIQDMLRILPRRIQRNDQIISFGVGNLREPVDFYFYRKRRRGHYQRGATMTMWWYASKSPITTDGTNLKDFG